MKTQRMQEGQLKSENEIIVSLSSLLGSSSRHATDGRQPATGITIEQQQYLAYMLRLWQVSSDGEPIWRASLESPHTGERHGFANLEALFAFLEKQTAGQSTYQLIGLAAIPR
jgi:hypothetical protein